MAKQKTWPYALIILLLTIVLVVIVTLLVYYRYKSYTCLYSPLYWCWTDWDCKYSTPCSPGVTANCWPGVTAIYQPNANICRFQPGTTTVPGCTCQWSGTGASAACG